MNETLQYYEENAIEFCENTIHANMDFSINKFLSYLKKDAHILDAGCGSGRDSKTFMDLGYYVTSIDASQRICEEASKLLGKTVVCKSFEEIDERQVYDGIWACASLLHIHKKEINEVMNKLWCALKDRGILYCSFKYGEDEVVKNGRFFNNYNADTLKELLQENGFVILELLVTKDVRKDRQNDMWVSAIVSKNAI